MSYPQTTFHHTTFTPHSFLSRLRHTLPTTLRTQLSLLCHTGRYEAFRLQPHPSYADPPTHWPVPNHLFWDSDVAKWIEGACYLLSECPEEAGELKDIDEAVRELVDMIRGAQQDDGYLNIHFTVVDKGGRFTNLRDLHELYNAGHLIEAALIHHHHYKNTLLLDPILKYVDLLYSTFGPGPSQLHGYPGHPEIELALLRLYALTGGQRHHDLAHYFITERGRNGGQFYTEEAAKRGDRENEVPRYYPEKKSYWYQQAHKPILEQQTIKGHAVRAMYLLTAVADLVRQDGSGSEEYLVAVKRLWADMVGRKMYETGGIGAVRQWEGFGDAYFLPQATDEGGCYAETCASIGIMMLAERLLKVDLNAEYADTMELAFYNTVLTSMSVDGKSFTYLNQLASSPQDLSKREEWFECACCPPNIARTLGMMGGYIWSWEETSSGVDLMIHLYTAAALTMKMSTGAVVTVQMTTDWPWDGKVSFAVTKTSPELALNMKLRIPKWAENKWTVSSGGSSRPEVVNGYISILEPYSSSGITLDVPMKPRVIRAHPFTNRETACIARGPIVYCVEDIDNSWVTDHFKTTHINLEAPFQEELVTDPKTNETYVQISMPSGGQVYDIEKYPSYYASYVARDLVFIPFYFRANRGGKGHMRVGLKVPPYPAGRISA
ncbi:uncharacterized protein H6S33_001489 [Morchella sextelata]|uniref:uncharacterized protein n=1 Tax=Morchella sextelata TaxID=1174677 RepID=UPI001D04A1EA|nr:uncharacterized protein H6S33_001489 [Morchella sextelata]KAH0608355.1 hypothetical protein H6S33_001489 [Morchella sextelata]